MYEFQETSLDAACDSGEESREWLGGEGVLIGLVWRHWWIVRGGLELNTSFFAWVWRGGMGPFGCGLYGNPAIFMITGSKLNEWINKWMSDIEGRKEGGKKKRKEGLKDARKQ